MSRLPRDSVARNGGAPCCPWCGHGVDDAVVRLEDLAYAHALKVLEHAPREDDGRAGEDALTADCSHCRKPFAIALQSSGMRLLAVRTEADARLGGAA